MVLLTTLEAARDLLSRHLVREYHALTDPDLNFTIISSLLQLLFLRTGQECGFVEPDTLALLAESDGIAGRMARACADAGLIPGVFLETGHRGSPRVPVPPDAPLRELIFRMNEPGVPVPIVRLPLEELVRVFEHVLGTRMQAAEGHRVKRTGKSALLYCGTVDIPPQAVIGYVVSAAAGEMTEHAAADNQPACRVLDPACGAGLFLLAAARFLARRKSSLSRWQEPEGGVLRSIICTSVFGTDIDPESVCAARFVLLLACIEEYRESDAGRLSPHQTAGICACLTGTVRCGNALIGPDYFSGKPVFPFNADERQKVNPFDWTSTFPEIIASGGFDAVVGAPPPYRPFAVAAREDYFQMHYATYSPSAGLYGYFIEKGLSLLRPGGVLAYLVPATFLRSRHARPLRCLLLSTQIDTIAGTGMTRTLQEGPVPVYVLSLRNQPPARPFMVSPELQLFGSRQDSFFGSRNFMLDQRSLDNGGWNLEDTREGDLLKKIKVAGTPLDDYILGQIDAGIHRIPQNPRVVDPETRDLLTKKEWWCRRFFIPLVRPADIRRYVHAKPAKYLVSVKKLRDLRKCRAVSGYLESALNQADAGTGAGEGKDTAGPSAGIGVLNREPDQQVPKIIFSPCQQRPAFCYDPSGSCAVTDTLLMIPRNDPYLAAVLNSTLGRFIITRTFPQTGRGFLVNPAALGKFPLMTPDFEKRADKIRHGKIVALVTRLLSLHDYGQKAGTDQERRLVQQEIDATDVRIDALVYEVYGLTREEIAFVESASRS
jgi:SAM-dependent methyltransferase